MIVTGELIASVRYILNDMQGTSRSDFEIVEALNRGASLLYTRMGEEFISVAVKKSMLVTVDGDTALPPDFHNVRKVRAENGLECAPTPTVAEHAGEYRIIGDRFEAADGIYGVEYYYLPRRVSSADDPMDVPNSVRPYLEEIAVALLEGNAERAERGAQVCCHSLAGRELSRLHELGPVQVWGGRA
jgi:hypothetical protein